MGGERQGNILKTCEDARQPNLRHARPRTLESMLNQPDLLMVATALPISTAGHKEHMSLHEIRTV